jgi:putative membrane protein
MTRHLRLTFLAATAALAISACSPENPASEATTTPVTTPDGSTTIIAEADGATKNYVEKAAIGDMFEIEASKIALDRSKVQPVKDFAKMMIDAHTATSQEMGGLATAAGVMAPSALDNDHSGKLEELRTASLQDFDDKYIDQQTAAHSAALDLHKDYANNGKDAALQAFAAKVAPTVDAHLLAVKALDKSPADDVTKPTN